jgi:hypothetical protein
MGLNLVFDDDYNDDHDDNDDEELLTLYRWN